jgi:hypothetical protein
MRSLVGKIKSNWKDASHVLPAEVFSGIGDLTFMQLSTLRHRGAFSTVSLTFARCCQLTQYQALNIVSYQHLLEHWYQVCHHPPLWFEFILTFYRVRCNAYPSKLRQPDAQLESPH